MENKEDYIFICDVILVVDMEIIYFEVILWFKDDVKVEDVFLRYIVNGSILNIRKVGIFDFLYFFILFRLKKNIVNVIIIY